VPGHSNLKRFRLNNNNNNNNKPVIFTYLFFIFSGTAAQRGLWPPFDTWFIDHTQ
jgi:hypothetical protein